MKIRIQSVHFDASKRLLDFIQKKANKLDVFFDRIIDGEIILRVDKSPDEKNKIVEMKVHIPGSTMFAKEQCKSFEEAADMAFTAIQKQIQKHKGKTTDHTTDKKDEIYLNNITD